MKGDDPNKKPSSHVLRCKQSFWTSSVTKASRRWLWRKVLFTFEEEFIQNYAEDIHTKGYIPEVDFYYLNKLQKERSDLPFFPKTMQIDKCDNLCVICTTRRIMAHI